jgi:hypothetical protein
MDLGSILFHLVGGLIGWLVAYTYYRPEHCAALTIKLEHYLQERFGEMETMSKQYFAQAFVFAVIAVGVMAWLAAQGGSPFPQLFNADNGIFYGVVGLIGGVIGGVIAFIPALLRGEFDLL